MLAFLLACMQKNDEFSIQNWTKNNPKSTPNRSQGSSPPDKTRKKTVRWTAHKISKINYKIDVRPQTIHLGCLFLTRPKKAYFRIAFGTGFVPFWGPKKWPKYHSIRNPYLHQRLIHLKAKTDDSSTLYTILTSAGLWKPRSNPSKSIPQGI